MRHVTTMNHMKKSWMNILMESLRNEELYTIH
jgi:hypothetical protein